MKSQLLAMMAVLVFSGAALADDQKLSKSDFDIVTLKQDVEDLKKRVAALEGRTQAIPKKAEMPLGYTRALDLARSTKTPLLVFVGVEPRQVDGFVTAYEPVYPGLPSGVTVAWVAENGDVQRSGHVMSASFTETDLSSVVNELNPTLKLPSRLAKLRTVIVSPIQRVLSNSCPTGNCNRGY